MSSAIIKQSKSDVCVPLATGNGGSVWDATLVVSISSRVWCFNFAKLIIVVWHLTVIILKQIVQSCLGSQ